jgi:hypothetical protein
MAKITAALVTVTLNLEDIDRSPDGRIGIRTFPTVQFGNAALEYTALGIPMPAIGKFGFHFAIKRAYIEQPANGFIYHFDRANHKLRIFQGSGAGTIAVANHVGVAPTGNVAAPANHVGVAPTGNVANHVHVENEAANYTANANTGGAAPAFTGDAPANFTHTAPAFTGDAPANLTHTVTGSQAAGALSEVGATHAPAATTLYMEMVGR